MKLIGRFLWVGVLIYWLLGASFVQAGEVRIAVASNFYSTMKMIARQFTQKTQVPVRLSNGATGMLYAQIKQGAPFDLYFSADAKRPELLETEGLIVPHSRFTYAIGQLVVWSTNPKLLSPNLQDLNINHPALHFVAIANPKIAPYGVAGKAVLEKFGLYEPLKLARKLVQGENVGKTFAYVQSGNAQVGLVAKSYLRHLHFRVKGKFVEVPQTDYEPILQQAVVLKGRASPEVKQFLAFFNSRSVQQWIVDSGYGVVNL